MEPERTTTSPDDSPDLMSCDAPSQDALRAVWQRARLACEQQRENAQRLEERLEQCLAAVSEQLAAEAGAEYEERLASVDQSVREFQEQREALDAELATARHEIETQREQLAEEAAGQAELQERLESHERELAEREADAQRAREEFDAREAQCAQRERELQELSERLAHQGEGQQASLIEEHQRDLAKWTEALEASDQRAQQLSAELEEAQGSLVAAEARREELARESQSVRDDLARATEALTEVEKRLSDAQHDSDLEDKFQLALADVQQHRQRIDELERELASRPAHDGAESAELLRLRDERDELVARVERLEEEARQRPDDADQDTADLQRRFELAVEDVRQLRREKEELEQRLANSGASAVVDDGAQDWESQKRRLLANLEEESGEMTHECAQERATVEGTIKITDEVVAEKDREIERLREQLSDARQSTAPAAEVELFDDDVRLEAERARLAQLEHEWRDKLRQAELEMSVERAKIARDKAEVDERRIDLEALRESLSNAAAIGPADAPARRQSNWLRKLGLSGDE